MATLGQTMKTRTLKSLALLGLLGTGLVPCVASAESRRICDTPMDWTYAKPAPDVPVKYQKLLGLWTGSVQFLGSAESTRMCIAVAINGVTAEGQTTSTFAWNLGDGSESPNLVSMGVAHWSAQSVLLIPGKGEELIFASVAPYRGRWYRYILDFPMADRPDEISGFLYATKQGSATDQSPSAWTETVEAHRVILKRDKTSPVSFQVPTN